MPSDFHRRSFLPAGAVFGGIWLLLCLHLATHWAANEQYSYGWLVPPLALFLGWRRWEERPAAEPASTWGKWIVLGAALLFAPAWLLAQPNADSRGVSWLLAADGTALLLGAAAVGGGANWARHFAFPLGFLLAAVPWPSALETPVIGGLMHGVAACSVTLLNAFGTFSLQHGNLIETRAGLLGIDEACSGVRSLQATLMAALFFGEFHRFRQPRRLALLAAGIGVAFATNVGRAFFLAWTAGRDGLAAVDRWHDPAGFTVALICFVLVWGIAALLARSADLPPAMPPAPLPAPPTLRFVAGMGGWLLLVLAGTELWFRDAPTDVVPGPEWEWTWPSGQAIDFRELPVAPNVAAMLRADEARSAAWLDPSGGRWLAYHFRWAAGARDAQIRARIHRPENCLPSAGWELVEDRGVIPVVAGVNILPFHALRFRNGTATAHVWICRWEDRPKGEASAPKIAESPVLARLQAVLQRKRARGQQVLEAVFLSPFGGELADAAFRREIAAGIHPTGLR